MEHIFLDFKSINKMIRDLMYIVIILFLLVLLSLKNEGY
uniref:Uncharacterized protein n=1 Tax=viral metagenome TaxID=1070528 RepID=A0A6C0KGM6_9ZZZZ